MPVPTRRLAFVAAVVALVLVVVPGSVGTRLLVGNAVVVGLALVDWLLAPAPRRIGFERELPAVLALGQPGTVEWRVRNPLDRTLRVAVADELAPSLRAGTRRAWFTVRAHGGASATTRIVPARRGRFVASDVVLRVLGPLGLMGRQRSRKVPGELRVYPPFRSRQEAELRIDKARILEVGLRSAKGRGGGTEFDHLRDYTVDDEFRRIDWAATARATKPIVRTYRAERNQTVLILLDNGRVMAGRVADVPRVEHAMDAVMMLTAVATRLGDRCGLVAFDRRVRSVVKPGPGQRQLTRVTEAMYELEPELAESDYRGAFTETLVRFRRRAMLVILTDLVEQAVGESLLPALPLILRSHVVVVAGVRDPDVVSFARDRPTEASDAYRKSAAVAALGERDRTVARLRGLGANVVDAPPGELAPRLADVYLKVKATGRL